MIPLETPTPEALALARELIPWADDNARIIVDAALEIDRFAAERAALDLERPRAALLRIVNDDHCGRYSFHHGLCPTCIARDALAAMKASGNPTAS